MDELEVEEFSDDFELDESLELPKPKDLSQREEDKSGSESLRFDDFAGGASPPGAITDKTEEDQPGDAVFGLQLQEDDTILADNMQGKKLDFDPSPVDEDEDFGGRQEEKAPAAKKDEFADFLDALSDDDANSDDAGIFGVGIVGKAAVDATASSKPVSEEKSSAQVELQQSKASSPAGERKNEDTAVVTPLTALEVDQAHGSKVEEVEDSFHIPRVKEEGKKSRRFEEAKKDDLTSNSSETGTLGSKGPGRRGRRQSGGGEPEPDRAKLDFDLDAALGIVKKEDDDPVKPLFAVEINQEDKKTKPSTSSPVEDEIIKFESVSEEEIVSASKVDVTSDLASRSNAGGLTPKSESSSRFARAATKRAIPEEDLPRSSASSASGGDRVNKGGLNSAENNFTSGETKSVVIGSTSEADLFTLLPASGTSTGVAGTAPGIVLGGPIMRGPMARAAGGEKENQTSSGTKPSVTVLGADDSGSGASAAVDEQKKEQPQAVRVPTIGLPEPPAVVGSSSTNSNVQIGSVSESDLYSLGPTTGGDEKQDIDFTSLLKQKPKRTFQSTNQSSTSINSESHPSQHTNSQQTTSQGTPLSPGSGKFVERRDVGINYMQPYREGGPRVHSPGMAPPLVGESSTATSSFVSSEPARVVAEEPGMRPARDETNVAKNKSTNSRAAGARTVASTGGDAVEIAEEIEGASSGESVNIGAGAPQMNKPRQKRPGLVESRPPAAFSTRNNVVASSGAGRRKQGGGILKNKDDPAGGPAPVQQVVPATRAVDGKPQQAGGAVAGAGKKPPEPAGNLEKTGKSQSGTSLASLGYSEDFEVPSDATPEDGPSRSSSKGTTGEGGIVVISQQSNPTSTRPRRPAAQLPTTNSTPAAPSKPRQPVAQQSQQPPTTIVASRVNGPSRKGIANFKAPAPVVAKDVPRRGRSKDAEQGVILTAENARNVLRPTKPGQKRPLGVMRGGTRQSRPTSSSSAQDDASIQSVTVQELPKVGSDSPRPITSPGRKSPTDTGINVENVDPAWLPPRYQHVAEKVMATCAEEGYTSPPRSPGHQNHKSGEGRPHRPGTSHRPRTASANAELQQESVDPDVSVTVDGEGGDASTTSRAGRSKSAEPGETSAAQERLAPKDQRPGSSLPRARSEKPSQHASSDSGAVNWKHEKSYGEQYVPPSSAVTSAKSPKRARKEKLPDFIRMQKAIDKARKQHVLAELQQMLNETWRHDKQVKMRQLKQQWDDQRQEQLRLQTEEKKRRIQEIEAERKNYVDKQLRDRQNYLRRREEERKRKEAEQRRFADLQRVYDDNLRKEKLKVAEREREKYREKYRKKLKFVMPDWID
ncbi:unnamed protein product [Amoebophrya sp. A120]|nr:unnamed protein product [Amoebophrya sp. A120]|eukprot:GSA120T00012985001.1